MAKYHELRIVLPLSLAEYEAGHIYTRYKLKHQELNKRSQTDVAQCTTYPSHSSTLGYGLYTHHVHLFKGMLPQWALSMLSGAPLKIHGRTWDEFPYIVAKYELPSIARANIQIDFYHVDNDDGQQQNVFNLPPHQLSQRSVEYWDICEDPSITSNGQQGTQQDPAYFAYESKNEEVISSRGPLLRRPSNAPRSSLDHPPAWFKQQQQHHSKHPNAPPPKHMCVYVLLQTQFELPLQVLRNHAVDMCREHFTQVVVELHRLAYVWLGEYDQFLIDEAQQSNSGSNENDNNDVKNNNNNPSSNNTSQKKLSSVIQLLMNDVVSNGTLRPTTFVPTRPTPIQQKYEQNNNTNSAASSKGVKGLINRGKKFTVPAKL